MIEHLLNSTVDIQRRTVARDALGGMTESFATIATADTRMQVLTAKETNDYSREGETITHRAYFSFGTDIAARDRILFDGKTYIVRTVENPDYENRYLAASVEFQN